MSLFYHFYIYPFSQSGLYALGVSDLGRNSIFAFLVLAPSLSPMVAPFQVLGKRLVVRRRSEVPHHERCAR